MTLRVEDLDLGRCTLTVRGGKGDKDRSTVLPPVLHDAPRAHLTRVKRLHDREPGQRSGVGGVAGGSSPEDPERGAYVGVAVSDVSTTMIYTHVLARGPGAVRSPLELLSPHAG